MVEQNWTIAGLVMMVIFLLLASIFQIMKEKACSLIAGYNFKSKEERKKYDENSMSADMRNFFLICSGIFFVGAVASVVWGSISFWISFGIWLVYFLKNLHIDEEKAFGKYRK